MNLSKPVTQVIPSSSPDIIVDIDIPSKEYRDPEKVSFPEEVPFILYVPKYSFLEYSLKNG